MTRRTYRAADVRALKRRKPRSLRKAAAVLRKHCPVKGGVRVVSRRISPQRTDTGGKEELPGYCYKTKRGGFVVVVDSRGSHYNRVDVLIHEWAHAMSWDAAKLAGEDTHGALFGIAYSRVYSVVEAHL